MKAYQPIPMHVEAYATQVVDSIVAVHNELGPGLLEQVYEACLAVELHNRGIPFARQIGVPVTYRGTRVGKGLRVDIWVDHCLIVEVKAVEILLPVHHAQVLTYLKLTGNRLAFLVNFNVVSIRQGIKRLIL